jgi:hypothetical protein
VRRDISGRIEYEAKISEANKTSFIPLFLIEANRRIVHAKQITTEANIPF